MFYLSLQQWVTGHGREAGASPGFRTRPASSIFEKDEDTTMAE